MSNENKEPKEHKLNVWVKADGKTEVKVNSFPDSEAAAIAAGWTKKGK